MKSRLTCVLALLVPFLALGPLALALANSDQDDNPAAVPIHGVPDFSNIRPQLQALVNARAFHEINHFCAVGYDVGKVASEEAEIYWPTQNKILVWFGGDTNSMLNPINYIDIKNDVVKSIDWQHPPGILPWTRADVADLLNDCRHHGNTYTIKRTVGHWIALKKLPQFTLIYRNLEYLVDHDATTEINRFCVVGQKSGGIVDSFV
jgi:hypothetical protein